MDRTAPALLATIIAGGATLPVAVSGDGSTALQINPDNRVVLTYVPAGADAAEEAAA